MLTDSNQAYYEILSIEKTSSDSEIKKAYRKVLCFLPFSVLNRVENSSLFSIISLALFICAPRQKQRAWSRRGFQAYVHTFRSSTRRESDLDTICSRIHRIPNPVVRVIISRGLLQIYVSRTPHLPFYRDPDKRAHYDRYGGNPESRFSSAASSSGFGGGSPFGRGFAGRRPGGMGGGAEVTPEELFNMFFGGGGAGMRGSPFGGGFGGPGMQTFSFGPGGFQQRGGFARRTHAAGAQQNDNTPAWLQLLPILFLLGFMLLSQASSLFYTPPPPDPAYSFEPTVRHTLHRQTQNLKADY